MEQSSYYIAQDLYCDFEPRDIQRIAMPELYDMISGTDTGAIIAASLIVPNNDPESNQINRFWA